MSSTLSGEFDVDPAKKHLYCRRVVWLMEMRGMITHLNAFISVGRDILYDLLIDRGELD